MEISQLATMKIGKKSKGEGKLTAISLELLQAQDNVLFRSTHPRASRDDLSANSLELFRLVDAVRALFNSDNISGIKQCLGSLG